MSLEIESKEGRLRFDRLLAGTGSAEYDRPLLSRKRWLLAPTLGAIVPGWFLAIPRRSALSLREWAASGAGTPQDMLLEVQNHLGLQCCDLIWFEHGPAGINTSVGCGLDHAHLHLLVKPQFTFSEFFEKAQGLASLGWCEKLTSNPYRAVNGSTSYLIAGSGERSISALNVEHAGSQFFRRVIAEIVGKANFWDYRRFSHDHNVTLGAQMFRHLESAHSLEC